MRRIIFLIVLLFFVSGCSIGSLFGGGGETTTRKGFGGSSGISMSFVEDAPVKEIGRDKNIKFIVNVKNTGTFNIPSGAFMVRVTGLDNNFNPNILEAVNPEVVGMIDESGVGGDVNVDIGSTSYNPEKMFADRIIKSGDLQVEVCYPYETKVVSDNFWIGGKTSDVSKGSIGGGDNSNSPVHVSELVEKSDGSSTEFSFKIKVVGSGSVVSNCFPKTEDDKKKNVELQVLERDVSCYYENAGERQDIGSGGSVILNTANEKVIRCTVPFNAEKPVKSQLQMQVNYYYSDKISVPEILIRKI
ncbi:MAG: membrane lipoprotein lipid attachment site-containing protein [archaeon]